MPVSDSLDVSQLVAPGKHQLPGKVILPEVPIKVESPKRGKVLGNVNSSVKVKSPALPDLLSKADLPMKTDSESITKVKKKKIIVKTELPVKTDSPSTSDKEKSTKSVKITAKTKLPGKLKSHDNSVLPSTEKAVLCQETTSTDKNGKTNEDSTQDQLSNDQENAVADSITIPLVENISPITVDVDDQVNESSLKNCETNSSINLESSSQPEVEGSIHLEAPDVATHPAIVATELNEASESTSTSLARSGRRRSTPKASTSQTAVNPYNCRSRRSRIFIGLRNHGSTCYLNSLVQSLYLTPEFRDMVWKWNPVELKNKSLAKALQTVFTNLKVSEDAVSTKIFFESPEWQIKDLLIQMDVQELKHELFDKLEASMSCPEAFAEMKDLFTGALIDYIKCLKCNSVKTREDSFQDISLPLREDSSRSSLETLERVFLAFVEPEVLTGDNQYSCDVCRCKCDALKGTAIKTSPPVLTILLKRFDYNARNNAKTKNNDRVEYPFYLDITDYLVDSANFTRNWEDKIEENTKSNSDSDSEPLAKQQKSNENGSGRAGLYSGTSQVNKPEVTPSTAELSLYELYSVLVHGGTTTGGHYYTFIKSMETRKWYKFDDQIVDEVTEEAVKTAYGGRFEGRSGNAYMLLYRRVENKEVLVESSVLPSAIEDFLENEANQKIVNLYYTETNYKMIFDVTRKRVWKTSATTGPITVKDIFAICITHFGLNGTSLDQYRIVLFDPETAVVERSLDDGEEIIKPLHHDINIWLQVRSLGEYFPPCPKTQISPYVILLNPITKAIENVKMFSYEIEGSVEEFRNEIANGFHIEDADKLQLIIEPLDMSPRPITADSTPLRDFVGASPVRFYVTTEPLGEDDFASTALYEKIFELRSTSQICVILPPYRENEENYIDQNEDDEKWVFSCCDEQLGERNGFRRVVATIQHEGTLRWLRTKFAELLRINRATETIIMYTVKLINATDEEELIGSYTTLAKTLDGKELHAPNFQIRVHIQDETVLSPANVSMLNVHNVNPFSHPVDVAMERQATVGGVKKEVIKKMAELHQIQLPFDMCRLRLLDRGCFVARILHDKEKIRMYQDMTHDRDPKQPMYMCLQVVPEKERLFSSKHDSIFLFVQKYNVSDKSLGRVDEIYLTSGSSNEFACKLIELTQIPEKHLKVMLAMTNFPAIIHTESYSRLATTWWSIFNITSWWELRVYSDGQLIFYRDTRLDPDSENNYPSSSQTDQLNRRNSFIGERSPQPGCSNPRQTPEPAPGPSGELEPSETQSSSETQPSGEMPRPSETKPSGEKLPSGETQSSGEMQPSAETLPPGEKQASDATLLSGVTQPSGETQSSGEMQPSAETLPLGEKQPSDAKLLSGETPPSDKTQSSGGMQPSAETLPSGEKQPSDATLLSGETPPSDKTQSSGGMQPSAETLPSGEKQPSDATLLSGETQPSEEILSSGETQPSGEMLPSGEMQPSGGTQPSGEMQPSGETQPSGEAQPSGERQPPGETQLPGETQPSGESQPYTETQLSGETQPSGNKQPSGETQPSGEPQPSVPGEQVLANVTGKKQVSSQEKKSARNAARLGIKSGKIEPAIKKKRSDGE